MPWNLLILPLLGGYYLLTRFNPFKFKQQRLDKQRLLFDSVLYAILLLLGTFIVNHFLIKRLFPGLKAFLIEFLPLDTPFIGTALASFLVAIILTELGNVTFWHNRDKYIDKSIKDVGNELELLLRSSVRESKLLEFTLDTGKFYIAWVKELPIPTVTNYIRVIPFISGYRDDMKKMVFTTHYNTVYSQYIIEGKAKSIKELDVDLIITLDNVVSLSYFDLEMYERFKGQVSE